MRQGFWKERQVRKEVYEINTEGNFLGKVVITDGVDYGERVFIDSPPLSYLKEQKFKELNFKCEQEILGYFDAEVNGVVHQFSFDDKAQANFTGTLLLFNVGAITTVEWTAWLNGEVKRVVLTKDQFLPICQKGFAHRDSRVKKLRNDLEPLLVEATTPEQIESIVW